VTSLQVVSVRQRVTAHQHIGLLPTERQHKCLNTTADPYFKGPMFELETVHSH